jgi:protein-tyrosine phosphatase
MPENGRAADRPFAVLHVCVGNICRSPMAERLLVLALREHVGDRVDELFRSHGAGTGSWHVGDSMNPPAAREVSRRGGDASAFRARLLTADLVEESDLVLCATSVQVARVLELRPDAKGRTFVIGELGRLLRDVRVDHSGPPGGPGAARARGRALVAAVDAARAGAPSRPADDLDDPYGMSQAAFASAADEIESTVVPLAAALAG